MRVLALAPALAVLAACAHSPAPQVENHHSQVRHYDAAMDASSAVDAALARAAQRGTKVMLVMGANWCHDSRALADLLDTPRSSKLIESSFELVLVNVGMPQTGDGHNLDIARRFGLASLPGTPNVLIIDASGRLLNPETATSWRDAASRDPDAIHAELAAFTRN